MYCVCVSVCVYVRALLSSSFAALENRRVHDVVAVSQALQMKDRK